MPLLLHRISMLGYAPSVYTQYTWSVLAISLLVVSVLHAQTDPVRVSGSFSLSDEAYSSSGVSSRLPGNAFRAVLAPTITIYDQIRLPFEIYWTNNDRGFRQPFNQFGVSPTLFGWVTLHAGYFSSRLSDLTFGDTRLLGGGVELKPGNFRFSFLYGTSQRAASPDTAGGFLGSYSRRVIATRVGYGNESVASFDINFMHAQDDASSLPDAPAGMAPKENAVLSVNYGFALFHEGLRITGETAVSGLSNDTRIDALSNVSSFISSIFTPRYSTQVDAATQLALIIVPSSVFNVRLNAKLVGPGFETLGYLQLPNDLFETTIAPAVRLFQGDLYIKGSLGIRQNNLRSNRLATTRRTIGNLSVNGRATADLGIDLQYSNYGMRSNPRNDTLRIDNITQMIMVSPHYSFAGLGGNNMVMVSYSFQDFTDYNVVTERIGNNRSRSAMATWTLAFPSSLNLATSFLYVSTATSMFDVTVQGLNETVGYSFFENALTTSMTVGYNLVKAASRDGQVNLRLSAAYALPRWGTFTLSLMNNRYDYGDGAVTQPFQETLGSLQYALSF